MATAHAAVVGIDGAGKTTLLRVLQERATALDALVTLPSLACHEIPGAPFRRLSCDLQAASRVADELGSAPLKAAVLYLQMTLFAPVERFLRRTRSPRWLISDRHPLVDTLVYGALYQRLVSTSQTISADSEGALRERLNRYRPGAYAATMAWLRSQGARAGGALTLRQLVDTITTIFASPPTTLVSELSWRYRTRLPVIVFLIDVDSVVAVERRRAQAPCSGELHEQAAYLHELRGRYEDVLGLLRRMRPELVVHRISNRVGEADAAAGELLAHLSAHVKVDHGS